MRINGQGPDAQLKLYLNKNVNKAGGVNDAKARSLERSGDASAPEDRISLSSKAKEASMAAELARTAPDIRTERVADLKSAINSGQYQVEGEKVAEKVIREALLTS